MGVLRIKELYLVKREIVYFVFLGDVKSVEFFNIFVKHRNGSDGRYRIRYTSKFE